MKNIHYKTQERIRKDKQFDVDNKIVSGFGDLFGPNKKLQKSKHKRNN